MNNCYSLLGIVPTAATDEIEEAYQKKKKEFGADASMQQELDNAYNEAIMATFAPIRAFASPLPPLDIGKKKPQPAQSAPPVRPAQYAPPADAFVPPPKPARVQPAAQEPELFVPPASYQAPSPPEPIQPIFQSSYSRPYASAVPQEVQALVKEVPVSFTDTQLMSMDVSDLRESMPQMKEDTEDSGFLTLGIENRLLRFYAKIYIVMVLFDFVGRLWAGANWVYVLQETRALGVSVSPIPPDPVWLSIVFSLGSIFYFYICSLPMPFATRFFLLGQPPDKSVMRWTLFFLAIMAAFALRWLTGRFLPAGVVGSQVSLAITTMALGLRTLLYAGD